MLKNEKVQRLIAKKDLIKARDKKGKKVSLSSLASICKKKTSPKERRDFDITPTPSPTPTQGLKRVVPQECIGPHGKDCPVLLDVSPEASPGDAINISGGTFTADAKIFLSPVTDEGFLSDEQFELDVLSNQFAVIQARIPGSIPLRGLWAVWIEQQGAVSNTLFINKAKALHQSTRKIAPGDELIVWGRALSLGGIDSHKSEALFVGNGDSLVAKIIEEDPYKLRIEAPAALKSGVSYQVFVSNGAGSDLGRFLLEDPIVGIAKGSDPLGLKVWWVNEFKPSTWTNVYNIKTDPRLAGHYAIGNGVADDRNAIEFALNLAGRDGGGTVYLPPGIYHISDHIRLMYPNIILLGAGQGSTFITYGDWTTNGALAFAENNVKYSGVSSLTFINQKPSNGNGNFSIFNYWENGIEKIFINDVKLLLGNQGQTISLGNAIGNVGLNHILISNCDITLTKRTDFSGMNRAALSITQSDDIVIRNNTIRYDIGRVQLDRNNHLLVMDNHFIRNGSAECMADRIAKNMESGGIEFSFTKNVVFDNNQVDVSPPPPVDLYNDGEVFMTQSSIYSFSDWGEVSSATETTITDDTLDCNGQARNWKPGDLTPPLPGVRAVLAITRGTGLGQWRYITSGIGKTITVEKPFDIIPDSTSSYTITEWTVDNPYLLDNRVEGGWYCIDFFTGGIDVNAHRNTCIDAGTIQIQGIDLWPGAGSCKSYERYPAWNTSFTQNVTQVTSRRLLPSNIKIQMEQFTAPGDPNRPVAHGNTVFNSEMRDNAIIAGIPNVPVPQGILGGTLFHEDGKMFSTIGGAGHETYGYQYYPDANYGVLGTIASGNISPNYTGNGGFFRSTSPALGNKSLVVDP